MKKFLGYISEISKVSEFQKAYIEKNLNKVLNIGIISASIIAIVTFLAFFSLRITTIATSVVVLLFLLKILNKKGYYALAGILTSFTLFFKTRNKII